MAAVARLCRDPPVEKPGDRTMIRYARFETTLGTLFATAEGDALTGIYFEGGRHAPAIDMRWREASMSEAPFAACRDQLRQYFEGRRKAFELPLAPRGTEFQQRVWREIARIPYGETLSYAALAERAGAPGAARAAG